MVLASSTDEARHSPVGRTDITVRATFHRATCPGCHLLAEHFPLFPLMPRYHPPPACLYYRPATVCAACDVHLYSRVTPPSFVPWWHTIFNLAFSARRRTCLTFPIAPYFLNSLLARRFCRQRTAHILHCKTHAVPVKYGVQLPGGSCLLFCRAVYNAGREPPLPSLPTAITCWTACMLGDSIAAFGGQTCVVHSIFLVFFCMMVVFGCV